MGPGLEHHEHFCYRMLWESKDLIKPESEQIKGNYVPTSWAPATLWLPGNILVAFGYFSHKGLDRVKTATQHLINYPPCHCFSF